MQNAGTALDATVSGGCSHQMADFTVSVICGGGEPRAPKRER
jgi:hypothetical protein